MVGYKTFRKSNWLVACAVILVISYMDWLVSIGYVCQEVYTVYTILKTPNNGPNIDNVDEK